MKLFLVLLGVPLIEIALFVQIGGYIGVWATLACVVLTAAAGALLLRAQAAAVISGIRQAAAEGRNPADQLLHGLLLFAAALLLLTPGFFTDAIGFALLVPSVRSWTIREFGRHVSMQAVQFASRAGHAADAGAETIEGRAEDVFSGNRADGRRTSD